MLDKLSDRSLTTLLYASAIGVGGGVLPFFYFGQWAMVMAWVTCLYLCIESVYEIDQR